MGCGASTQKKTQKKPQPRTYGPPSVGEVNTPDNKTPDNQTPDRRRSLLAFAGGKATDEMAHAAFDAMDTSADGLLDKEECKTFLDSKGYGAEEIERFFARTDLDGNGMLDFEEFHRGWGFLNKYCLSSHQGETLMRKPGAIRGIDMVVENCTDSTIMVCDHTSAMQVDFCTRCKILLGPCADSVFVRNCEGCTITLACRQLRTRDCRNCTFFLYCATEPIIETSKDVRFAPFNAKYPQLTAHFGSAGLDPEANLWYAIYDFNKPENGSSNWTEVPEAQQEEWVLEIQGEAGADMGVPENPVPRDGRHPIPADEMRGMAMGPNS